MEWPVLVGKVMLGLDLDERSLWLSDWRAGCCGHGRGGSSLD